MMSSAKRKPRTPSPLEDGEGGETGQDDGDHKDMYAGRRVSVSEFEFEELMQDHGSVASPGASSTSSEPTYHRQPGFECHAHEVSGSINRLFPGDKSVKSRTLPQGSKKKKSSPAPELNETEITIAAMPCIVSTKPKVNRGMFFLHIKI